MRRGSLKALELLGYRVHGWRYMRYMGTVLRVIGPKF